MTPAFAYLQSRLQAQYGQRLDEQGWRRLELVAPYRLFLKSARETTLAPWLLAISDEDNVAVLEHRLREALHHSVVRTALWCPGEWRAAVHWTSQLWLLPAWQQQWQGEPLPAGLVLADTATVAPLQQAWQAGTPLLTAWLTHWRSLWPPLAKTERNRLERLIQIFQTHADQFAELPDSNAARLARQQLQQRLAGLFRQQAGQPVALFVYLARMALDFERLRGGLLLRALYHANEGEAA
ncbi:MAG: hypothetical protein HQL90_13985 [Magnetococcales bacterium]|nr:hypothetical protein [Magnetococcales bacterium]